VRKVGDDIKGNWWPYFGIVKKISE
jgi:hypothetical protein